jgi:hypothetical protein
MFNKNIHNKEHPIDYYLIALNYQNNFIKWFQKFAYRKKLLPVLWRKIFNLKSIKIFLYIAINRVCVFDNYYKYIIPAIPSRTIVKWNYSFY